jgi:hypothetical protein
MRWRYARVVSPEVTQRTRDTADYGRNAVLDVATAACSSGREPCSLVQYYFCGRDGCAKMVIQLRMSEDNSPEYELRNTSDDEFEIRRLHTECITPMLSSLTVKTIHVSS